MSTNQISPILTTRLKSPRVKILKGRVIIFKIGLMKKLISPKKAPAIIKYLISPVKATPGTNFTASQKLKIPPTIWKKSLAIRFYQYSK